MNLANRKIGPLVFAVACAISWSASADKVEIKGFPRFTQPDGISCGVTAGKIVLRAYNIKAGIGPLKTKAGTRWFSFQGSEVGMTHPGGLRDAMVAYGLPTKWYTGVTLNDVRSFVRQGRPPILLLRSARDLWHFTVVYGYDVDRDVYLLSDPASGQYETISGTNLERAWRYSHDMYGNYIPDQKCPNCKGSKSVWTKCVACGGSGWHQAGPLKTHCVACSGQGKWSAKCPICSGKGHVGDFHRKAVEMNKAVGHSAIVPLEITPLSNRRGTRHALSCIRNPLNVDLNISFKWGNGDWQKKTIRANSTSSHWWDYNWVGQNRSPDLYVRFDSDMSSGQRSKEYRIRTYAVETTNCRDLRPHEVFAYSNNSKTAIDLYHNE